MVLADSQPACDVARATARGKWFAVLRPHSSFLADLVSVTQKHHLAAQKALFSAE
jgi:hypothetical protein